MDPAAFQLILLALQTAPALIDTGRDLLAAMQGGLSEEQSVALDQAQREAHEALQAAVAVAVAEEKGLGE